MHGYGRIWGWPLHHTTIGYLSFGPMAQCVVHALKGLACRARVIPACSPASHCGKQSRRLRSTCAAAPVLLAHAEVTTTELKRHNGVKTSVLFHGLLRVFAGGFAYFAVDFFFEPSQPLADPYLILMSISFICGICVVTANTIVQVSRNYFIMGGAHSCSEKLLLLI